MKLRLIESDPMYLRSQLPWGQISRYIPAEIAEQLEADGEDITHHVPVKAVHAKDGVIWDWYQCEFTYSYITLASPGEIDELRKYWGLA